MKATIIIRDKDGAVIHIHEFEAIRFKDTFQEVEKYVLKWGDTCPDKYVTTWNEIEIKLNRQLEPTP